MSTLSLNPAATPARSNLAKLWTAWQIISVALITGYSAVFFSSLGSTPKERSIYLALALLLPVIACVAWAVGFTAYRLQRYVASCFCFLWGFLLFLIVSISGAFQIMVSWGLLA